MHFVGEELVRKKEEVRLLNWLQNHWAINESIHKTLNPFGIAHIISLFVW